MVQSTGLIVELVVRHRGRVAVYRYDRLLNEGKEATEGRIKAATERPSDCFSVTTGNEDI